MNRRAVELGMENSHFENSNGWPAEGHLMSVRDLGVLAEHLITDFPELYKIFAEQEFEFDGRVPSNSQNRNPILGLGIGADGLKTGHTQEAGYGLVGSAVQGDRRVTFVLAGLSSEEARRTEGERILNWAFRNFELRDVAAAGERIGEAEVWMGAADRVGLALPEALSVLVPAHGGVEAEIVYEGPLSAPVEAGAEVAHLRLRREGLPDMDLPLVAEAAVARGGFGPRMRTTMGVLMARAGLGAGGPAPEAAPSEMAPAEGAAAPDDAAPEGSPSGATQAGGNGGEPLADGD
jgi:D-alanyl-D-alanine carboxypeptidase (penicillin-binding protein 5/6)